ADPDAVRECYHRRCATIGSRVRATLLPRGEARGTAVEVDRGGRLVLRSPTGMTERIPVDTLGRISLVPPGPAG
ncbi:MAG: biotin--[acetyl-CoA-carboxylase] ligase, partial [Acidimicrobiales bacterium]